MGLSPFPKRRIVRIDEERAWDDIGVVSIFLSNFQPVSLLLNDRKIWIDRRTISEVPGQVSRNVELSIMEVTLVYERVNGKQRSEWEYFGLFIVSIRGGMFCKSSTLT